MNQFPNSNGKPVQRSDKMRENRIKVSLNKPVNEVFDFTTNPQNTPTWIESLLEEEVDGTPIRIGTKYRNKNKEGQWTEYVVTNWKQDALFELKEVSGSYLVRYSYTPLGPHSTELEYYERDENGLSNPFEQGVLEKLKKMLEGKQD